MNFKETYLSKNKSGYYQFRRGIPEDLQPVLKKIQIYRSLKTRQLREALRLCQIYAEECEKLFRRLRKRHGMSEENEKDELLEWSKSGECKYLVDSTIRDISRHEMKINMLPTADGSLRIDSFELDPDKMDSELEMYKKTLAINAEYTSLLSPLVPSPAPIIHQIATNSPPASPEQKIFGKFSEVVENFYEQQIAEQKWTAPKVKMNYESTIALFIKFFGDRLLHTYHKSEAEEFRSNLQKIPVGWLSIKATASLTYEEAIALKKPKLTNNSARAHLLRMHCFFDFAVGAEYIEKNIFDNVTMKKEYGREREPFSMEALQILFEKNNFISFQHYGYPSRYWAPLLACFTGCRKGEIFFLDVDSVYIISRRDIIEAMPEAEKDALILKYVPGSTNETAATMKRHEKISVLEPVAVEVDSFWVIDINANGIKDPENPNTIKKVKNFGSRRKIPIHPHLISLGFLDFLQERKKDSTDKRLFKEYDVYLEEAGRGFGETFRRWIRNTASTLTPEESAGTQLRAELFPKGMGIHAFRHLFISETREQEMSETAARRLTGHAVIGDNDTHVGYGGKRSRNIQALRRLVKHNAELQRMNPGNYFPAIPTYAEMKEIMQQRDTERAEAQKLKRRLRNHKKRK